MSEQGTLETVCDRLGIKLENAPDLVPILGVQPSIVAYFPQLGDKCGLIVVNDFKQIEHHLQDLISAGYAFSTVDWQDTNETIDEAEAKELFIDWGWASNSDPPPNWLSQTAQELQSPDIFPLRNN